MSKLSELVEKIKYWKQRKLAVGSMSNGHFREQQTRAINNHIAHYERAVAEFGGGQNVYSIKYRYSPEIIGPTKFVIEYYQADTLDEAKAACLLHNQNELNFFIDAIREIKLRCPK